MLIDSHCHLTDERLVGEKDEIISSLRACGLESVITVGYDVPSSLDGEVIARENEAVYCTLGMHPHDAKNATQAIYDTFAKLAKEQSKVVAIGEIGLDYYYDLSPREVQRRVFAEQLELAHTQGLPVCLHVRDAYGDCLEVLKQNKQYLTDGVLLHCYSGSAELVREFSRFDAYFAFGGAITFKNARHSIESAQVVPRDRLLVETDSPYMTPVPFRGKTNYPRYVALVADKLSEVLGVSVDEVTEITNKNTKTLFKRMK